MRCNRRRAAAMLAAASLFAAGTAMAQDGFVTDCFDPVLPVTALPQAISGDTTGADNSVQLDVAGTCGIIAGYAGPDDVYAFSVSDGNLVSITLDIAGSAGDLVVYVLDECGEPLSCVDGSNDEIGAGNGPETIAARNYPAGTYYVVVDSFYAVGQPESAGTYTLTIDGSPGLCQGGVAPAGRLYYRADFEAGLDGFEFVNGHAAGSGLWRRGVPCVPTSDTGVFSLVYNVEATCTYNNGVDNAGVAAGPLLDLGRISGPLYFTYAYYISTEVSLTADRLSFRLGDTNANIGYGSNAATAEGALALCDPATVFRTAVYDIGEFAGGLFRATWAFESLGTEHNDFPGVYLDNVQLIMQPGQNPWAGRHAADRDADFAISLSELLRAIQYYNSGGLHCSEVYLDTEDGFVPGLGADTGCAPHSSDYAPQNWVVSLSELLRLIQFYNSGGFAACPEGEDGFCPLP